MSRKTLILIIAVLMMAVVFTGCKSESDDSGDVVKSAAEYKTRAVKEMNDDDDDEDDDDEDEDDDDEDDNEQAEE